MNLDTDQIRTWPDDVLAQTRSAIMAEQERRLMIRTLPGQVADFIAIYQRAAGIHATPGEEWTRPDGYLDAYAADVEVTHDGRAWISLRSGVTSEPGVAAEDWAELLEN
jgi:hypothetical protein